MFGKDGEMQKGTVRMLKRKRLGIVIALFAAFLCLTGCAANPLEEGLELLEEQKYGEAAEKFQDAAEKGKDPGEAYRGIGIARWELQDYEAACSAFEKALENGAQKTATLYHFLGDCKMKLQDFESARTKLKEYLADYPDDEKASREAEFLETR